MTQRNIKAWYLAHKWTILVCTAFLLMLCLTGLPLIFHHELEEMLGHNTPLEQVAPGARAPSLDAIVATALKGRPGEVVQYAFFDEERPVVTIGTADRKSTRLKSSHSCASRMPA